jgi:vacuolar protein-sorting-associated protein 4
LIDEKNDRLKDPIRKRFVEYLDRAEMLKEFLNEQEKKQKEPIGVNGASKK